jgi:hypothetical protein
MAVKETKWDKMIIGMIKATNKGDLTWSINSFPKDKSDLETKYDVFFKTKFEKAVFILYIEKYKAYRGPIYGAVGSAMYSIGIGGISFKPDPNEKIWYSKICLDVVSEEGLSLYQITGADPLRELFEIVKEKASGIEDIRKRLEEY